MQGDLRTIFIKTEVDSQMFVCLILDGTLYTPPTVRKENVIGLENLQKHAF